jgi:hypothetical protein
MMTNLKSIKYKMMKLKENKLKDRIKKMEKSWNQIMVLHCSYEH